MKKLLSASSALGLWILSTAVYATPAVEPRCTRTITHPPSSAGVLFNDDCTIVYIKPPPVGDARVRALAQNLNLNFCSAMNQAGAVADRTLASAATIADQIAELIASFDGLRQDLAEAEAKAQLARVEKEAAEGRLSDATAEADELKDDIAGAKASYDDCVLMYSPAECTGPAATLQAAKDAYRDFALNTLRPAQTESRDKETAYKKAVAEQKSLAMSYTEALDPIFGLQERLANLNDSVMQVYKEYAPLEGATGQIVYSIPWDRLLQDYQAANSGRNLNLQTLPLASATFTAAAKFNSSNVSSLPAVLEAALPGSTAAGPSKLPQEAGTVDPNSDLTNATLAERSVGFGTSLSGQIVLSLTGACPYFPNGVDTSVGALKEIDIDQLAAHMQANVFYTYEMKARRGYTVSYNLSQWLSRVEKKIKKGGFLSSTTIHEIINDGDSTDWFSIQWDVTSKEFSYSDQEKKDIEKEEKSQLTERALKLIAVQNGVLGSSRPNAQLSPTGAGAAAAYLTGACGFWSWCGVTGFFLGTLDSIFGRSSATSSFRQNNSATVTDVVRDTKILDASGSITFAPPQR